MPAPAITHEMFGDIEDTRPEYNSTKLEAQARYLPARVSPVDKQQKKFGKKKVVLRAPQSRFHGVTRLNLMCGDALSESFNPGKSGTQPAAAFCFCPGKDEVTIGWNVRWTCDIAHLDLELSCLGTDGTPQVIHSKRITDAKVMLKDPKRSQVHTKAKGTAQVAIQWRGTMAWSDFITKADLQRASFPGNGTPFPAGKLTTEFSPYKLSVKVTSKANKENECWPSLAWTYFHVLIGEMRLSWAPLDALDKYFPGNAARLARLKTLYARLADKKEVDNLAGALPTHGQDKKVFLARNKFYPERKSLIGNWLSEEIRALWGDGPDIPILAEPLIQRADGRMHRDPELLGNTRFLWDYVDVAARPGNGDPALVEAMTNGARLPVQQFLDTSANYKIAPDANGDTPGGRNCHFDRGGKRGATNAHVFVTGNTSFPFHAARLTGSARKWLTVTQLGTGKDAGMTGIIFQPSRMAGDGYELRVYQAARSDVDNVALSQTQDWLARTGRFQVWHSVDFLRYVKLDNDVTYDTVMDKVQAKFAQAYLEVRRKYTKIDGAKEFVADIHKAFKNYAGAEIPDWMRSAFSTAKPGWTLDPVPYDTWRQKLADQHSGGDPKATALHDWVENTRPKFGGGPEDMEGAWEDDSMTALMRPFPFTAWNRQFDALLEDNKIHLGFDDLPGTVQIEIEVFNAGNNNLEFRAPGLVAPVPLPADTELRLGMKRLATRVAQKGCGVFLGRNDLKSFPSAQVITNRVTMKAKQDTPPVQQAMTALQTAFEAAMEQVYYDASKNKYTGKMSFNWSYFVVCGLLLEVARARREEGVTMIQGRLTSNEYDGIYWAPAGKSEAALGDGIVAVNFFTGGAVKPNNKNYVKATLLHETGHFVGLNHTLATADPGADPRDLYQQTPARGGEDDIMRVAGALMDAEFCGMALLRLRGWSLYARDVNGNYTQPQNVAVLDIDNTGTRGAVVQEGTRIKYTAPAVAGPDAFIYRVQGTIAETGVVVTSKVWVAVNVSAGGVAKAGWKKITLAPNAVVRIDPATTGPFKGNRTLWNDADSNKHPAPTAPSWREAQYAQNATKGVGQVV